MQFLIDLLKKATKGDNFRPVQNPDKYDDKIAQLNLTSNNQFNRLNTTTMDRIQKTNSALSQNSSQGSTVPK